MAYKPNGKIKIIKSSRYWRVAAYIDMASNQARHCINMAAFGPNKIKGALAITPREGPILGEVEALRNNGRPNNDHIREITLDGI